ncbi:glycyl-radical enzyme activating protein [Thomasclavelia sp.]|uniref:glycyl-radical enzyme activating protein n=1 Tax=Thomasclavelia sp. TaxID=3025757 RepID=UPI0025DB4AD9|nr:glycyl-radical enzyme activating protein [Thomasclavelia sp.]
MCQGTIFNIQKFSIHDGPGIRTTVFFKGCPLKCKWCSNPESQSTKIQILYDQTKCIHCLNCLNSCPNQAISLINDLIVIDDRKCIGCLTCINSCFQEALSYEGKKSDVDSIVDECLKDLDFYEESNGGVTISGGEAMCQPGFLKQLVLKLKEHNLHVAIETTGYIDTKTFQELAPLFDLLLFDVKHVNNQKHQEGTGVTNDLIKANLNWLIANNINVLPRIPVIPGFNNTLDDAKEIATYLAKINIKKVQLLPFHQFGEKKYDLLNRDYSLKNIKALYPEDLADYQKVFIDNQIDCFF